MLKRSIFLVLLSCLIASSASAADLATVLGAQPAQTQARYGTRHPLQTLEFFGIKPGMTVIEALPGGGWYSRIISQYLGSGGRLIGADYAYAMYPMFNFYDDAYLEAKKSWTTTWKKDAAEFGDAAVDAFLFGSMPSSIDGEADAILFIRATHNLARFEGNGGYLTSALADAHQALKSGGIVGVVQHMAPADASDAWANGSNGYIKKQFVIDKFTAAGFTFVGESDVNINPADKPTEDDFVWRLPPSLATSKDKPALAASYRSVGETSRMTLLFKKP